MSWLHHVRSDSIDRFIQTGLPRKFLKHLIASHGLRVGSRVLDVGCGEGKAVQFLDRLGISAVGLDESAENIVAARKLAPQLSFFCAHPEESVPCGAHQFDLVLVRKIGSYDQSLFSSAALKATANLLACVKPGGHLVFALRNDAANLHHTGGHQASCLERQLEPFSLLSKTKRIPEGLNWLDSWKRLARFQPRSGCSMVSLQCPPQPILRIEWCRMAEAALATSHEPCCHWSVEEFSEQITRRNAA